MQPGPTDLDDDLLTRLRAGEDAAFAELVARFGGRMHAVCRRILASDDDALDAVQDALLSAFRALGTFQGEASLSTWLHRIAVNAALMKLRSARRRDVREIDAFLPRFDPDGHHSQEPVDWVRADERAERADTRELVRRAIDRLPEMYRTALVLRDLEQLENEELAQRLGISVNAAKIRVHRARQALRGLLEQHFSEDAP